MITLLVLLVEAGALGLLVFLIVRLGQLSGRSVVQRAPLLADQTMLLQRAGRLNLCLEGPIFSTYSTRLQYSLFESATGRPVPLTPTSLGSGSNTFTRQRVTRAAFTIPAAGWYRLVIAGFEPARDYRDYAVVVTRPFVGALIGLVLGIVAVAFVVVGGLVIELITLTGG
jgi:hypothetical protein